jgi:outer membrane protein TolC
MMTKTRNPIKRFVLASVCFCAISTGFSQDKKGISLEELQKAAKENYPLLKQKDMQQAMGDNRIFQLKTNFLPQMNVTGQATYQSEVTQFNIPIPGVTGGFSQKPDQYSLGLEVRETIFDYGAVKTQHRIEKQNIEILKAQIDVDYQKVKERINQIYAAIRLNQENKIILLDRVVELNLKIKKMRSAVNNGAALKSNLLTLEAELLSTHQRLEEVNSNLVSAFKVLSLLTNKQLDTAVVFTEYLSSYQLQNQNIRIEYKLFDLQSSNFQLKSSMVTRNNLPKLFVFARGYYGRPGYNFMNNDFRNYGLVGAGLSWNLSNYYTAGKEKKNMILNQDLILNQKQLFDLNLQTILVQQQEEISKLQKMISLDEKIVQVKTEIRKASSSQLDNGIITASDFISDLNNENQAQLNRVMHEIQWMIAKQNYNTSLGY